MYTFFSIKNGSKWASNFIFGIVNLHQCSVVPTKLQVRELISCFNIQDLRCEVGATVYTVVLLYTGNSCFSRNDLHEPVKVFHEGGPVLPGEWFQSNSESGFSGF